MRLRNKALLHIPEKPEGSAMTYIGGTLYAPVGFDHETFKDAFDQLVQASLEVDELSAIGRGTPTSGPDIRLKIKTVWIEESVLTKIEASLSAVFYGIIFVVEAVGLEQATAKPDYSNTLADVVKAQLTTRQQAQQLKQERIERDIEQERLNHMSLEELQALGYNEEYKERLEQESWANDDPYFG